MEPGADVAAVTAIQLRDVIERLIQAGQPAATAFFTALHTLAGPRRAGDRHAACRFHPPLGGGRGCKVSAVHDDVYRYNEERWQALVAADALFTRPMLDLDKEKARAYLGLEKLGISDNLAGRKVLCLAGGGGQQSVAFALLGADVTVFDISSGQLERDRSAAEHYGVGIRTVQGDMRDLSALDDSSFDLVWHPYSLTFVPDCRVVFREVARVVREGGHYYLMCANPFFSGLTHDSWNGDGYTLKQPYTDEAATSYPDQEWVYDRKPDGHLVREPREYRQTLSRIVNGLVGEGFMLTFLLEVQGGRDAEPGSWEHFMMVAPPWLELACQYRPGSLEGRGD